MLWKFREQYQRKARFPEFCNIQNRSFCLIRQYCLDSGQSMVAYHIFHNDFFRSISKQHEGNPKRKQNQPCNEFQEPYQK